MEIKTNNENGYNLHFIETKNFKTTFIKVIFWEKIKKEELVFRNMLINNLLFSSKTYNTQKKMNIKKDELYGTSLYGGNYRRGNYIFSEINLSFIDDKYSEKGLRKKVLDFFLDVLSNPNVCDNEFDKSGFLINYESLKSDIESEGEDPGYYSILEYKRLLDPNKAFSFSITGDIDSLNKVTPKNLYDYYKQFFSSNNIDIFIIGSNLSNIDSKLFSDIFNGKSGLLPKDLYLKYEKDFSESKISSKFSQSRLLVGGSINKFTRHEQKYESLLFNIIFGNSPNSKLFKNVREKNSYAYSVSSSISRLDGIFVLQAGISKQNYENTKKEIMLCLDEMKNGKFTISDVKNAKAVILGLIKEINDYQGAIIDHAFNRIYLDIDSIDRQKEEIKKITKEDIVRLAKKIDIDTILLVEEKDNERD